MSVVEGLYRRYVREYRDAGDADPRPYLQKLNGVDRAELSLRIDRFLQQAPAPAFSAEEFARFRADPARQTVVERVLHPETLASMRKASGFSKARAAAALTKQLGLTGHERAVKARYHDIEAGNTDPARIRLRVWDALSAVLKAPSEKLREAAEHAFGGEQGVSGAFARAPQGVFALVAFSIIADADSPEAADEVVDRVFFGD